jgi:hypothetical protein
MGDTDLWSTIALSSDSSRKFTCGHCSALTATVQVFGFYNSRRQWDKTREIRVCMGCRMPTFFTATGGQIPTPPAGRMVEHLPAVVAGAYKEALDALQAGAPTAAALMCRKVLMNVAVNKGAKPNLSFAKYVDFLTDNHWVPPGSDEWLTHVRQGGNEATHEIAPTDTADALELVEFTESLLTYVFELPGRMQAKKQAKSSPAPGPTFVTGAGTRPFEKSGSKTK